MASPSFPGGTGARGDLEIDEVAEAAYAQEAVLDETDQTLDGPTRKARSPCLPSRAAPSSARCISHGRFSGSAPTEILYGLDAADLTAAAFKRQARVIAPEFHPLHATL